MLGNILYYQCSTLNAGMRFFQIKQQKVLHCQGIAGMLLGSGIVALVSLVEEACALVLLLLYACVPGWPQLFLCIIDGKVRIAEVMR